MPGISDHAPAESALLRGREYIGIDKIDGALIFLSKTHPVGYRELIECVDTRGNIRLGIVLETATNMVVAQIFEGTSGLTLPGTSVRFCGEPLRIAVSREMLGRVFNGLGEPIDNGPPQRCDLELDVNGMAEAADILRQRPAAQ
jgi:V/A-type H+-transporting ATPase subunit B